jgi:hypothetical protein
MTLGYRSISSLVKSSLIAVIGNSLVFPVAPGYKVDASFIAEVNSNGEVTKENLIDLYKPDIVPPPYRLSVPTRGVYSEAALGQCDSCEKIKPDSSQDWSKFTVDDAPAFGTVSVPTPSNTAYNPQIKDFATPMVSIQNAPALPEPNAGLASTLELLGKASLFKDITGLDANQANAIKTLTSNNESARTYAQMAAQSHNTTNSTALLDQMKQKKEEGALPDKEYQELVKSHFQHQIDGGKKQAAEVEEKKTLGKKTPVEAAAEAGKAGLEATASSFDSQGYSQAFTVKPPLGGSGSGPSASWPRKTLADVGPDIKYQGRPATEDRDMACWGKLLRPPSEASDADVTFTSYVHPHDDAMEAEEPGPENRGCAHQTACGWNDSSVVEYI